MVRNNSGPVFTRFLTKEVHKILGECILAGLPLFQKIIAIKYRNRQKTNKRKRFLAPNFFGKDDPDFSTGTLLGRFTVHRLAKFG